MDYEGFKQSVKDAAEELGRIDKKEQIRIISHLDSDGISSAAILINAFNKQNRKYSLSIIQQLTRGVIDQLSKEPHQHFVFTDIGSGQLSLIKDKLKHKNIFILDHHEIESKDSVDDIIHVNPHFFDIDGSKEICGAGIVYLITKEMEHSNMDMAHIAIVGALGDIQEQRGFLKLNNEILEEAVKRGKIKVINGLRMFGAQTKPLHKILEYSTEYYIPGVTGSESGAIAFLQQIGINPKDGKNWKKLVNITDEEMKKLATALVIRRLEEEKPEHIIGPVYILKEEERENPFRDAKEFSTLLNACGRLGKASLGIGVCLNDKSMKKRAVKSLSDYKEEIIKMLRWYETSEDVINGKGYTIINGKEEIRPTMIGTISSIISRSKPGLLFVLGLSRFGDSTTKVSLRICQKRDDINLVKILKDVTDRTGGQSGGHKNAAGALIPTEKEDEFIREMRKDLERYAMEESV